MQEYLGTGLAGWIAFSLVIPAIAASLCALRQARMATRHAEERANFLTREMNHRVKNLFAVALSIGAQSARENPLPENAFAVAQNRLYALARAHDLAYATESPSALDLGALVDHMLQPYRTSQPGGNGISCNGPPLDLPRRAVTPLALILHELATISAARGALAAPEGQLAVSWDLSPDLVLQWRQNRPPAAGPRNDLGQRILQNSVSQLGGTLFGDGAHLSLRIPRASLT